MTLVAAEVEVLADVTQLTLYEVSPNVLMAISVLKEKKQPTKKPTNKQKTHQKTTLQPESNQTKNPQKHQQQRNTPILLISPVCH